MPKAGLDFTVRPVEPRDLPAWIALANQSRAWPLDLEGFLFEEGLRPPGEPALRLAAWAPDRTLAATADAALGEYGERWTARAVGFISVAPAYRRQGLGTLLAERVEQFARAQTCQWLQVEVREGGLGAAAPLLQRREFHELERFRASRQDPSAIDLRGLEPLREQLRRAGIETVAFAAVDSASARAALYRCAMAIQRDMPHEAHVDWQDPPLATYVRSMFEHPDALPDGIFVARDADQVVGLTYLTRRPGGGAEVGDTGVLQSHRRRGIGLALKMMATRYAAEQGFRFVDTDNRSDNAGMLAINARLGFVPAETIVIFEKTLSR